MVTPSANSQFTNTAMGLVNTYEISSGVTPMLGVSTAYHSICVLLNILLTLMIIVRLILHSRNIRQATGASDRTMGLYSTTVTLLVESCALYAAALLLFIVPYATGSPIMPVPEGVVVNCRVRAVLAFPTHY